MTPGRGLALLVLATACWGAATASSDLALERMSAVDLLAVELLTATLALWVMVALTGAPARAAGWRGYALLGLCEPALTFLLLNAGLERTSAGTGALLLSLESLVVIVLAALFLRERISRAIAGALALGLAGTAVVSTGTSGGEDTLAGNLLVLGGVLAAAVYVVLARHLAAGAPAMTVAALQFTAATLICAPVVLVAWAGGGTRLDGAGLGAWAAAVFTGLAGGAGAFGLYTVAIAHVRAATAAVTLNLVPLFGLAAAVLALGEPLVAAQMAGAALILAGLLWLARSERRGAPGRPLSRSGAARAARSPAAT